jgi:hypothetical protein
VETFADQKDRLTAAWGVPAFEGIVADLCEKFELEKNNDFESTGGEFSVWIFSLKDDATKGFRKGKWHMTRDEVEQCYRPAFDGIAKLYKKAIEIAQQQGINIDLVLAVGGFFQSDELRKFMKGCIQAWRPEGHPNFVQPKWRTVPRRYSNPTRRTCCEDGLT